jgi:hypothetical protein
MTTVTENLRKGDEEDWSGKAEDRLSGTAKLQIPNNSLLIPCYDPQFFTILRIWRETRELCVFSKKIPC